MIIDILTGKVRHRTLTWLLRHPLLVLQVEVRHRGTASVMDCERNVDYTDWRDATPADLVPSPEYELEYENE